ncbi:hypothetical protein DL765_008976 [Monosporascus sp. GIB2]|nr:hypothetical protein DL765_008976 [Monosporascus sp. GIB2]
MGEYLDLDRQTVFNLLYPFPERINLSVTEEDLHPWQIRHSQYFQEPLLRIWDQFSGSQPAVDGRMMSRAPEMRLDNAQSRQGSLTKHLNHRDWTPGPYISFTASSATIEALAQMRVNKRGAQTLTVIDPNSRIRNGLPVLDIAAEMDHYNIPDPYGKSKAYYANHYVCLWQVTKAEIVGHWDWSSLADNKNWYQEIILPAFQEFTATTSATDNANSLLAEYGAVESAKGDMDDLQNTFSKLSVKNEALDYSNSDTSDGELDHYLDEGHDWDTDDEVEEANAADDMIKIIEGDW